MSQMRGLGGQRSRSFFWVREFRACFGLEALLRYILGVEFVFWGLGLKAKGCGFRGPGYQDWGLMAFRGGRGGGGFGAQGSRASGFRCFLQHKQRISMVVVVVVGGGGGGMYTKP